MPDLLAVHLENMVGQLLILYLSVLSEGFSSGLEIGNPPAGQEMQGTQVGTLGWKDPLEEEMVTNSYNLACKIPWTEEPGGLQSMGLQRVGHN